MERLKLKMGWMVGLVAWMTLLCGAPILGDELEATLEAERAALDSLKTKLEVDQKKLEATRGQEQSVSKDLERQEREIVGLRGELRRQERQERGLAERLEGTRQTLVRVESQLETRQQGMAERIREMYKLGRRGRLQILFSSDSFTEALKRVRYLSRIAEQDRQDYEAIRISRKRVDDVLQLQETQHEHQRALLKAKQVSEQRLSEHVTQREKELRRLRADASARRREIQKTEAALAESSERIAKMIQELQRRKQLTELPPFDFPGHRGKLRKPVAGKIVERFGRRQDPELKTWTFHRGVNLAAPEGKDVVAVAPGEVVMVDWFPGYGQFVLLRHPGGFFTLYGHLASVQVNRSQLLAEGAILGQVGSTGRVDGVPQLHFEIMEGEQPLDPMGWIK